MNNNVVFKPASQEEINFYCHMGEAICMIQVLEEALSHAIIIKTHPEANMIEVDKALSKQRRLTLGKAVHLAGEEKLFPLPLQKVLVDFYQRRNWLVHHSMVEYLYASTVKVGMTSIIQKIKSIGEDAQRIQRAIEMDMMNFCEANGQDMSSVRATIEKHEKGT